jgi:hypothetical protein
VISAGTDTDFAVLIDRATDQRRRLSELTPERRIKRSRQHLDA